jgi:phospholipase C
MLWVIFMSKWGVRIQLAGLMICMRVIAAAAVPVGLAPTATPIKYLVVIDDENISFDHYFGTYPAAANPPGEPRFVALPKTPLVNGIAG